MAGEVVERAAGRDDVDEAEQRRRSSPSCEANSIAFSSASLSGSARRPAAAAAASRSRRRTLLLERARSATIGADDTLALMRIAVAADELTGVAEAVVEQLRERGHEVLAHGALADGERADWAWACEAAARDVAEGRAEQAIVCCWTGTGASIAANKVARRPGGAVRRRGDGRRARGAGTTPTCSRCRCATTRRRSSRRSSTPGSRPALRRRPTTARTSSTSARSSSSGGLAGRVLSTGPCQSDHPVEVLARGAIALTLAAPRRARRTRRRAIWTRASRATAERRSTSPAGTERGHAVTPSGRTIDPGRRGDRSTTARWRQQFRPGPRPGPTAARSQESDHRLRRRRRPTASRCSGSGGRSSCGGFSLTPGGRKFATARYDPGLQPTPGSTVTGKASRQSPAWLGNGLAWPYIHPGTTRVVNVGRAETTSGCLPPRRDGGRSTRTSGSGKRSHGPGRDRSGPRRRNRRRGRIVVAGLGGPPGKPTSRSPATPTTARSTPSFSAPDGKPHDRLRRRLLRDDVAIQPDGKIVVAGTDNSHTGDFALARYNTDGSLDTSFSCDGKQITDFAGNVEVGNGVAVQSDGRIVVAGSSFSQTTANDFAVARYNTDGSLDTGFSGDGKQTVPFAATDIATGLVIQADGNIVLAGYLRASDWPTATSRSPVRRGGTPPTCRWQRRAGRRDDCRPWRRRPRTAVPPPRRPRRVPPGSPFPTPPPPGGGSTTGTAGPDVFAGTVGRGATSSARGERATIAYAVVRRATCSAARRATTRSTARRAPTSCSATSARARSSRRWPSRRKPARATTWSGAARGTTASSAGAATTSSTAARAPTRLDGGAGRDKLSPAASGNDSPTPGGGGNDTLAGGAGR